MIVDSDMSKPATDIPESVLQQLRQASKNACKKFTTEQRREFGKRAWQTRLENARKKAAELEKGK